jgi:hypothetical protein
VGCVAAIGALLQLQWQLAGMEQCAAGDSAVVTGSEAGGWGVLWAFEHCYMSWGVCGGSGGFGQAAVR